MAHWRDYKAPASNGLDNLRAAATKGVREAGGSAEALRYWGYHLARATFFAGQAAAGVIAYQATATAARKNRRGALPRRVALFLDARRGKLSA